MKMNWLAQHRFQFLYFEHARWLCSNQVKRADPCSTLLYVIKGTARLTIDKMDHLVKPGMVLAVPQDTDYRLVILEPYEFFRLRYRLWLATGKPADRRIGLPPVFAPDDFDTYRRDLETMERCDRAGEAGQMRVEALAHGLVLRHLASDYLRDRPPSHMDPRAWRIRSWLSDAGLVGPYCGVEVAHKTGLSLPQMHRLFRRYFHDSPKSYWEKERLKIIKHELRATVSTMADLTDTYGFADLSHFSKWFKHLTGVPPTRYRRQHAAGRD